MSSLNTPTATCHACQLVGALGVGIATFVAVSLARRAKYLKEIQDIPGPPYGTLHGAIGTMLKSPSFFSARHLFLREMHAKYGPIFKLVLPIGRGAIICCDDPDAVEGDVLRDNDKYPGRPLESAVFQKGLLALKTSAMWRAHRSAVLPALTTRALRGYQPRMRARAEELCATLDEAAVSTDGERPLVVDVYKPLVAATLDIIGDVGFAVDFGALASFEDNPFVEAGTHILGGTFKGIAFPPWLVRTVLSLPRGLMPSSQRQMLEAFDLFGAKAREMYDRAVQEDERDGADEGSTSLLEALARAKLPFSEAHDEIISLLIAGHESTSNTLCWTLHLLAHDPIAQARAAAEVAHVCGHQPVTPDGAAKLDFLRCAFYEALRLYPTVPAIARKCESSTKLLGHPVPAGTIVFYSTASAARAPQRFKHAAEFFPERHATARLGAPGSTWLPFGGGARKCIGFRLAELEAITILATIVRAHRRAESTPARAAPRFRVIAIARG